MTHQAADVVRQLLIDLGLCASHTDTPAAVWPVFVTNEPDDPDNCVTFYNTSPVTDGHDQTTGDAFQHEGVMVRVRATHDDVGYAKADAVKRGLCRVTLRQVDVTNARVGDASYVVNAITLASGPLPNGKDSPSSDRDVFTLNFLVSATEVAGE